jgi:hypothetical protein
MAIPFSSLELEIGQLLGHPAADEKIITLPSIPSQMKIPAF